VLEAMQCGRPVFISRRTSLPEIAGDLGEYLDGFDGPSLAAAWRRGMARFHGDPHRGSTLRRHAATYSWEATARGYADVYAGLVSREPVAAMQRAGGTAIPPLRRAC
jgi:glycosyltransferase involved in cell wall biosynthesis